MEVLSVRIIHGTCHPVPQSGKSVEEVEKAVLEEFGHCLNQIITSAQSGITVAGGVCVHACLLCMYMCYTNLLSSLVCTASETDCSSTAAALE